MHQMNLINAALYQVGLKKKGIANAFSCMLLITSYFSLGCGGRIFFNVMPAMLEH